MKKLLVTTALVATMATSAFAQTAKEKVQEVAEEAGYELVIDNKGMKKIAANLIDMVWEKGHFLGISAMIATVNDIAGLDADNLGDLKADLQAVIDQKTLQEESLQEVFVVIAQHAVPFPIDFTLSLADNVDNFLTSVEDNLTDLNSQIEEQQELATEAITTQLHW